MDGKKRGNGYKRLVIQLVITFVIFCGVIALAPQWSNVATAVAFVAGIIFFAQYLINAKRK